MQSTVDRKPAAESPAALVRRWRLEQLLAAGFDDEDAETLAARGDVDLHAALDLLAHGCPPEIAAQILL